MLNKATWKARLFCSPLDEHCRRSLISTPDIAHDLQHYLLYLSSAALTRMTHICNSQLADCIAPLCLIRYKIPQTTHWQDVSPKQKSWLHLITMLVKSCWHSVLYQTSWNNAQTLDCGEPRARLLYSTHCDTQTPLYLLCLNSNVKLAQVRLCHVHICRLLGTTAARAAPLCKAWKQY